jgi:hypothetical protein
MQLIAKKGKASARMDRLEYIRRDGTRVEIDLPRQGILPHDLVHCVVESRCLLRGGFMSIVARGASPDFTASKAIVPDRELRIAESAVEAMQTQLAQRRFDHAAFAYGLVMACDSRQVAQVTVPDETLALAAFEAAMSLEEQWRSLPPMQHLELEFPEQP